MGIAMVQLSVLGGQWIDLGDIGSNVKVRASMWDRMIMLQVVVGLVTWDRTRHLTFVGAFDDDGGNTLFRRIDVMWNSSFTEEPFLGVYSIKIQFNVLSLLLFIEL